MKNCYLLETKLTKIFFEMEKRGIRVDPSYVMRAMEYESELKDKTISEIEAEIDEKFVDSPTFLKKMFTSRGVDLPKTAKGNVSTSFETFKQISDPLTPKIVTLRDYKKRIGTYYQAFLRGLDSNNRIHANIRQAGTKTGRLSYSGGVNLQNIPKEDEGDSLLPSLTPYVVRGCFIPSEHFKFVSLDYDQVEYKIMLDYAGEKPLIARVMDGEDLHQATADMLGISRKKAKTINFSCIAKDELVLTHRGLVKIQEVSNSDLLWDGENYVAHQGVVFQGFKEVIEYEGLRATRDHRVFTRSGRKICFGAYAMEQGDDRIAVTEIDGKAVRYSPTTARNNRQGEKTPYYKCNLLSVWKRAQDCMREYTSRVNNQLQMSKKFKVSRVQSKGSLQFKQKILGCAYKMQQTFQRYSKELEKLWGKRYSIAPNYGGMDRIFFKEFFSGRYFNEGHRSNRQQWSLRNWKLETGYKVRELKKPEIVAVYDIINCGPNHRFTVSGKLVSNCLYGSGTQLLAENLGVSVQEAQDLKRLYFDRLPSVKYFIKQVMRAGEYRGWVKNWNGRVYRINSRDFAYTLPNHLIQGSASEVIKVAMVNIHTLLERARSGMLVQIHDDILHEIHNNELELIPKIKAIMESVYKPFNGMKLTVTPEMSRGSWAYRDFEEYKCGNPTLNENASRSLNSYPDPSGPTKQNPSVLEESQIELDV